MKRADSSLSPEPESLPTSSSSVGDKVRLGRNGVGDVVGRVVVVTSVGECVVGPLVGD
jgi:hypothetical protein